MILEQFELIYRLIVSIIHLNFKFYLISFHINFSLLNTNHFILCLHNFLINLKKKNFFTTLNYSLEINFKPIIVHNRFYLFFLIVINFIIIIIFIIFSFVLIILQIFKGLFLISFLIYKHYHNFIKFTKNIALIHLFKFTNLIFVNFID